MAPVLIGVAADGARHPVGVARERPLFCCDSSKRKPEDILARRGWCNRPVQSETGLCVVSAWQRRIVDGGVTVMTERKERRGFASMSPEKQREIASKGGRAAHEKGTAHEWTADEARSAGRKGGQVSRGGRGKLAASADASAADDTKA